MELFTIEEINLLCIYSTHTRQALLADLTAALPDIYEPEMLEIFHSAIAKLEGMTDDEYAEVAPGLIPAEEYIGDEDEE